MGFFKTLIIIVAIWYFLKFAFRFFGPILLKKAISKAEQNFQQRTQDYYNNTSEEDYSYSNNSNKKSGYENGIPREKKKVGEYIEFEEIK